MGILFLSALFIGLFLCYYSVRYSYYSSTDYVPVYLIRDSELWNILIFLIACVLSLFLNKLFQKLGERQRLAGYVFLGLCCLLYAAVCLIWVTDLPYYPSGDQLNTTAAAYYNLNGNFSMIQKGGYIGKFPYQKGLVFLYEILFTLFGEFCYPTAAKMHIIMGIITLIFGYLFVEETSWNSICKILYCPLMLFCTPWLILTPYAYGDLPSICALTVLFWALLRFARTGHWRYIVLSCLLATFSLMMRVHTWIALIAMLIGMALAAWQKRRIQNLLAAILITTTAFGGIKLLDYSYALRSGYEITEGAPMILTLAMGLQNNEAGPGTYNNFQSNVLGSVDFDSDAAAAIGREDLQNSIDYFVANPDFAEWFFKTKVQMQWIEPSFETLMSTYSFPAEATIPDWINRIYFGDWHDPLMRFADRYQSLVYLGFLFALPVLIRKRRETAAMFIPLITIVGGFLFSIIWEAQCRYVLPYYLFMLLYVPEGICLVGRIMEKGYRRLRPDHHQEEDEEILPKVG
ncbi:MAG: hypothetical protein NC079_06520 [Clostridium sp.]|nr:hypothetical protein [Acetatifactor muris]MCM1526387.1 hypothetical protein [Bacteroides sp.]MCM1563250.1 hypothetical protein [Clostridium sp.]